ncbi:MAG: MATE family efflux transporter, partial [Muribaculaceae bacterium]|nr:MATE family efflux transporter [Muribaculaceae bacterium]
MVKHINRQILAIAVPAIIANITTPLLSIVDVTIVGHLGSDAFLAAIAIGGSMFNMLYWLFGFLRMGTSGLTAQAFGANDANAQALTLYRAILMAFAAGLIMILLHAPIADITLSFMDANTTTTQLAREYFSICIYGAPAVLGTYVLSGWFLGMQNSRAQMWISLVINVTNIVASLCLVYLLNLDITGVACGTLTAQWIGLLTALILSRRYSIKRPTLKMILRISELRRFFAVNTDIFLRTLCLVCVTVWFTRAGAQQSTIILDVNTLLLQLFMLFSYFMDGFAFAGEALCGRYAGARHEQGLNRCIKTLLI